MVNRLPLGSVMVGTINVDEFGQTSFLLRCPDEMAIKITEDLKSISLHDSTGNATAHLIVADYNGAALTPRMFVLTPCKPQKGVLNVALFFNTAESQQNFVEKFNAGKAAASAVDGSLSLQNSTNVFDARTDEGSATQYFQFYSYLAQQQNMLQDYVRTSTYQKAIHLNNVDFRDKVVMDVGAGSGILSFFAAQAGAKRVYAVEASSMSVHCTELVKANNLQDTIKVVSGRIEAINLPEKVDMIISEPMGYMLVNERMLESYMHGKKFLKPGGKMFPSRGDLHVALFNDDNLFMEQNQKANFWSQENFHGVNLTTLKAKATTEVFKQPIVDTWHTSILVSGSVRWSVDFVKNNESDLHKIVIPLNFKVTKPGFIHGVATWFDVAFIGTYRTVWLSTSPTEPLTHWYQVRCLLPEPLMGLPGDTCTGSLVMVANERQSYDIQVDLKLNDKTSSCNYDLKNPCFRYSGSAVPVPPLPIDCPSNALLQTPQDDSNDQYLNYEPNSSPYGATTPQPLQNGGVLYEVNGVQSRYGATPFNATQMEEPHA
uniref:type I protein arginine methyltransferase n=1 Tax=Steinernema glaseri TaxID=37863 RepID=A0A1I7YQL8_9BILA